MASHSDTYATAFQTKVQETILELRDELIEIRRYLELTSDGEHTSTQVLIRKILDQASGGHEGPV